MGIISETTVGARACLPMEDKPPAAAALAVGVTAREAAALEGLVGIARVLLIWGLLLEITGAGGGQFSFEE